MKIKSIVIRLEPENDDVLEHATELKYENNSWQSNGSLYPRFCLVQHEIIQLLKGKR